MSIHIISDDVAMVEDVGLESATNIARPLSKKKLDTIVIGDDDDGPPPFNTVSQEESMRGAMISSERKLTSI